VEEVARQLNLKRETEENSREMEKLAEIEKRTQKLKSSATLK
jgi:hypothetical protein